MRMRFLLLWAACFSLQVFGGNILDNHSFEERDPDVPALPRNWGKLQVASLGKHHFIEEGLATEGKQSARLENDNPNNNTQSYLLFIQNGLAAKLNEIPFGTELELSLDLRTDSPETLFRMYVEGTTTDGAGVNFISPDLSTADGSWQRKSMRFEVPAGVGFGSAYVCLQILTTGRVWVDNVYLGEAEFAPVPEGNVLVNPSVEEVAADGNMPLRWRAFQIDLPAGAQSLSDQVAHSGSHSLAIHCEDKNLSVANYVMWRQDNLAEQLRAFEPGTPMVLSLWANTGSNPSVYFRFYLEMTRNGEFIGTFASAPMSSDVGWKPAQVAFNMPEQIPTDAYVCLQLLTPGNVWFDDIYLGRQNESNTDTGAASGPENYFRVTGFPAMATWYWPDRPEKFTLAYELKTPGDFRVRLKKTGGGDIKQYLFHAAERTGSVVLELPVLEKGAYELSYGADGSDFFRIIPAFERGVKFDDENRMSLNGEPFFPVMVMTPEMSEEALSIYQQAGFNSIAFSALTLNADAAVYLAGTAANYGLAVVDWANLADVTSGSYEEIAAQLEPRIATARKLDNFIGWIDDESEMRLVPWEKLADVYRTIYEKAPGYVVWQNHAPRLTAKSGPYGTFANVRRYSQICDVTGIDIYPIPEGGGHSNLANRDMSCVGEYTDLARSTVADKKPVWMVLQAGSWGEEAGGVADERNPLPTYEQFRFMCYNALTHGADGWIFYAPGALGRNAASPHMGLLAEVLLEFRALERFVSAGDKMEVTADNPLEWVKIVGYKLDGEYLVIMVNESKAAATFTPTLPGARGWYQSPSGIGFEPGSKVELKTNEVLILSTIPVVVGKYGAFSPVSAGASGRNLGSMDKTEWIGQWAAHPELYNTHDTVTYARQSLNLPEKPERAVIRIAGDDAFRFSVNGQYAGEGRPHTIAFAFDIAKYLNAGENELFFELTNNKDISGLVFDGSAVCGETEILFGSGDKTRFSANGRDNWIAARLFGTPPVAPWGAIHLVIRR